MRDTLPIMVSLLCTPGRPAKLTLTAGLAQPRQAQLTSGPPTDSPPPLYSTANHGSRPFKGTLYISSFNASNSLHYEGHHSWRQWVSLATYPNTLLFPLLLPNNASIPSGSVRLR
jgi:hypothetical protein